MRVHLATKAGRKPSFMSDLLRTFGTPSTTAVVAKLFLSCL
jgi:hypothetical protein